MPHAKAADGVRLYYEEAGSGTPIIFVHEFAADYASWEPQMRYFARRHRCITYSARGYAPSDVPASADAYGTSTSPRRRRSRCSTTSASRRRMWSGCRWADTRPCRSGCAIPAARMSLTLAGTGSGSERWYTDEFRKNCHATAAQMENVGAEVLRTYGLGPTRIPFLVKDPRGHQGIRRGTRASRHQGVGQYAARLSGRPAADLRFRGRHPPHRAADADRVRRRGRSLHRAEPVPQEAHRRVGTGDVPQDRPHREPGGAGAVQRDARAVPGAGRCGPVAGTRPALAADIVGREPPRRWQLSSDAMQFDQGIAGAPIQGRRLSRAPPHTSTLAASAFSWMNSRRGSTMSPISLVNRSSASSTSLTFTCSSERALMSSVVSHSWSGFISPRPL